MSRPICKSCNKKQAAVNYWRDDVCHYKSICESCIKLKKQNKLKPKIEKPTEPKWKTAGYKKKTTCDACGFKSRYSSQMAVCYIDGNENNGQFTNLRTICLCCVEVAKRNTLFTGRIGGLEPDR
jgi:hypothetical protein